MHSQIRALADPGRWEQAVTLATSTTTPNSAGKAFNDFDSRSASALGVFTAGVDASHRSRSGPPLTSRTSRRRRSSPGRAGGTPGGSPVQSFDPLSPKPSTAAMPAGSSMAVIAKRGRLVAVASVDTLLLGFATRSTADRGVRR